MYRRYLHAVLIGVLAFALVCPTLVQARGSRSSGGGSRSSGGWGGGGSRTSGSWGGSSSGSSWGGRSGSSSSWGGSRGTWGSSNSSGSRSGSGADRAMYDRARANGTAFQSRDAAVNDFKSRYGSQYTSRFASEPSTRPSYIPQNYSVGGRQVSVIYNAGFGGYGYYHPVTGAWMMYSVMADMAMMNMLMSSRGYYYGAPPAYGYGGAWAVHNIIGLLIFLAILVLVIVIIVAAIRRRNEYMATNVVTYPGPFGDSVTVVEETYYEPTPTYAPPPQPTYGSVGPRQSTMAGSPLLDKWNRVTPGAIITLSDAQAFQDSIEEGRGAVARDYTVTEVRTIEEAHGYGVWKLFHLQDVKQTLWFLVKLADGQETMRCFFELPEDEFKPGTRREQIDNGNLWLFQEPADPQHFAYQDLRYTTEIEGPPEEGKPSPIFAQKGHGPMSGAMWLVGQDGSKRGPLFAIVVEYEAPEGATENPELLLLEINGVGTGPGEGDNPDGGVITMMQGTNLLDSEVVVMPMAGR